MMPDRECNPVEIANYNREASAEAARVRDFVALHYLATSRPEPFWSETRAVEPPASLAHSLRLFRERGRLPYHEEETFARDSWLAVLLGLGVVPRRTDPLIESLSSSQAEQAMAQMRASIAALVPTLPTQAAFLRNLTRQATR
jgi:tryptophan halogenase